MTTTGEADAPPRLPYDAVFRIEVSLSSQTTSAIVMRTTARLYCLEGARGDRPSAGDAEWKSLAYGAPCIQLLRQENGNIFSIKIVIAEVESGISLWETVVDGNSRYGAMQSNFHTFSSASNTYAIQFISDEEASRMLESMHDLLAQQQRQLVGPTTAAPSLQPVVFKKPTKPLRKLSKKDISSPCNFKHVSGITMQRTSSCEHELSGTIQRKMRSFSLSNLSRHKTEEEDQVTEEKVLKRKWSKRGKSLRIISSKDSSDVVATAAMKRADSHRMSLPSHFHPRDRQSVTPDSFLPPSHTAVTATATGPRPHSQLNRHLSQSSGDITAAQPTTPSTISGPASAIERRHTMYSHRPVNMTKATPTATPTTLTQSSLSDAALNHPVHSPFHTPVHEPRGPVQHVAIASSDIIGWTADGRLIVQIPQSGQEREIGRQFGTPIRRASTGQFASDSLSKQRAFGSSDALSGTLNNAPLPGPHSTSQPPASEKPPWSNRPLPLTPLDIAMPQSQALRNKTRPPPTVISSKPHPQSGSKPTQLTNGVSNSVTQSLAQQRPSSVRAAAGPAMKEGVHHVRCDSLDTSALDDVTDQMSRALAQFDELLGVTQTSL